MYLLYISSWCLLLPDDFWHKIWNFLRTKTQIWNFLRTKTHLGFTIHTDCHQFYWDQCIIVRALEHIICTYCFHFCLDTHTLHPFTFLSYVFQSRAWVSMGDAGARHPPKFWTSPMAPTDFEVLYTNGHPQSSIYVSIGTLSFKFLTQALQSMFDVCLLHFTTPNSSEVV